MPNHRPVSAPNHRRRLSRLAAGSSPPILRDAIAAQVSTWQLQGWSQADIARRAGMTPQRLNDYLADRRQLSEDALNRLLAALDLAVGPQ